MSSGIDELHHHLIKLGDGIDEQCLQDVQQTTALQPILIEHRKILPHRLQLLISILKRFSLLSMQEKNNIQLLGHPYLNISTGILNFSGDDKSSNHPSKRVN